MKDLIAKLEAVTEGSRELDAEIAVAIAHADCWTERDRPGYIRIAGCGSINSHSEKAKRYTTSLDAALTLVPKGWTWEIKLDWTAIRKYFGWAKLTPDEAGKSHEARAATPTLALCIAALKARQ